MSTAEPRRILVALDASPASLAAAAAAAELAAAMAAELAGFFVEDAEVLQLAGAAVAWQADRASGLLRPADASGLERELRAQAQRAREALERIAARAGVASSFRIARGQVTPEILAAAGSDLVALGRVGMSRGWGELLGSTARALLGHARTGVALLYPRVRRPGSPPAVLYTPTGPGELALDVAAGLGGRNGDPIRILVEEGDLAGQAVEWLAARGRKAVAHPLPAGPRAAGAVVATGTGPLLLPLGGEGFDDRDLRDLLGSLDLALLLLGAPASAGQLQTLSSAAARNGLERAPANR